MRLQTPTRDVGTSTPQHHTEHCTATLVRGGTTPLLVTAWHCIAGQFDLTLPPKVQLAGGWHPVRVLASGQSMAEDWAVISAKVTEPVTVTMAIDPGSMATGDTITAAGFSRDPVLGDSGRYLTYHEDCRVTAARGADISSDCLAFQGASGGPVLKHDSEGNYRLIGVISAGDSATQTVVVPVSRFLIPLQRLM